MSSGQQWWRGHWHGHGRGRGRVGGGKAISCNGGGFPQRGRASSASKDVEAMAAAGAAAGDVKERALCTHEVPCLWSLSTPLAVMHRSAGRACMPARVPALLPDLPDLPTQPTMHDCGAHTPLQV